MWAVEHHFTDYTLCPNIPEFLAFVAGQTKTIKLGTGVCLITQRDPIQTAKLVASLDPVPPVFERFACVLIHTNAFQL